MANEGDNYITVTFSGSVVGAEGNQNTTDDVDAGTGAGLVTNYKKNNLAFVATDNTTVATETTAGEADMPSATEAAGSTTKVTAVSIYQAVANIVGDVYSTTAIIESVSGGNLVAACSATVANDAVRPTATVHNFSIGAKTGLLSFSEKVTGFTGADMSSTSSGTDTTFTATAAGGNYYVFTHVDGSAFISGQVLTVALAGFTDLGALNMAAAKTATASTDNSAPTATASIASTTIVQPYTAALGTGGTMVFKALSTGVATGTLGELWTIEGIEGTAGAGPSVSLYDGSNRKVVISADFTTPTTASTPTPASICAAFNAHAEASATFNCVVATGNVASTAVWTATALGNATETSLIDVTWSETMNSGSHGDVAQAAFDTIGNYDVDADGSGTVDTDESPTEAVRTVGCAPTVASQVIADCYTSTGVNSFIAGTMQFIYVSDVYTERLTAGTSQLQISASTASDLANNAATAVTYKIVIN